MRQFIHDKVREYLVGFRDVPGEERIAVYPIKGIKHEARPVKQCSQRQCHCELQPHAALRRLKIAGGKIALDRDLVGRQLYEVHE